MGSRWASLVSASAAIVLMVAGAVWVELWLWDAAGKAGPAWLRTTLGLCAWFFIPAIVVGVAIGIYARRRRG